jgi:hypothetical protein
MDGPDHTETICDLNVEGAGENAGERSRSHIAG